MVAQHRDSLLAQIDRAIEWREAGAASWPTLVEGAAQVASMAAGVADDAAARLLRRVAKALLHAAVWEAQRALPALRRAAADLREWREWSEPRPRR
jgi:hypothetical protein